MKHNGLIIVNALLLIVMSVFFSCNAGKSNDIHSESIPRINIWYGDKQNFGLHGTPQRWVNVLGSVENISSTDSIRAVYFINDSQAKPLSLGCDLHRLARHGDFNIDLDRSMLRHGVNSVRIEVQSHEFTPLLTVDKTIEFTFHSGHAWKLPCDISWEKDETVQDEVEVLDGHWYRVPDGIRTSHAYYDRVVAVGDTSWSDYQVTAEVTIHGFTPPSPGPPTYNVTHVGIGLRWKGHHEDEHQPHRKWYPVGAATEFTLNDDLSHCRWRILPGPGKVIWQEQGRGVNLDTRYILKAQVETIADGKSKYRLKLWQKNSSEPSSWDLEGSQDSNDYRNGSALIVAHHTDITVHLINVIALD